MPSLPRALTKGMRRHLVRSGFQWKRLRILRNSGLNVAVNNSEDQDREYAKHFAIERYQQSWSRHIFKSCIVCAIFTGAPMRALLLMKLFIWDHAK